MLLIVLREAADAAIRRSENKCARPWGLELAAHAPEARGREKRQPQLMHLIPQTLTNPGLWRTRCKH
jgi:hypothetical protein